jgi:fibronectin-binding autotransporter adhesin
MKPKNRFASLYLITCVLSGTSANLLAQTTTWNSNTSGNFSDNTKWTASAPVNNTQIAFSNTTGVTATIDSSWVGTQINTITFNSGVGASTIAAGSGVTAVGITGSITNSSSNLQIFGSGLQLNIGTGTGRAISGGRLQFDGIVNLDTSATLTNLNVNSGQTTTFNNSISGGNAANTTLTFTGGTVALNASNSYQGTTAFASGTTVNIGASSNLGNSAGAVTADNSRSVITYAGTGTVTKGALTLNQTTLGAGNTLDLRSSNATSGAFEFTGAVTNGNSNAAIQMGGNGGRVILSGTFNSSFGVAGRTGTTASSLTFANTSGTQTLSGILGRAAVNSTNGADDNFRVVRTGAGGTTVISASANTYVGTTTINGGTLSVGTIGNGGVAGGTSLGSSSNAAANLVLGGGTLQFTGASGSTDRSFTLTTGTTSTIDVSTALTMSGASANTTGALIKTGAGTLTISGANAHTGGTTINGGTLRLSTSDNRITGALAIDFNGSSALDLNGRNQSVSALNNGANGGGTVKNTAAATTSTLTLTGASTFGGSITDGGGITALAITTGSAVALNGSSNYTGLTTLGSGGTGIALTIGASGNLGSASGAVSVGAARNVVTYAGSGTITKGALTLNQTAAGVNQLDLRSTGGGGFEFTGAVTNASPNAAIYLSQSGSPAALKLSGTFTTGDFGIAGRGGSVTFANTSGTQTLSGVLGMAAIASVNTLDNNFSVVRNGAGGTTILSGPNTYTGTTTVTAGKLLVNNTTGSGTGTGTVSVSSGATLGGSGTISGAVNVTGVLAPGNSIESLGSGSLNFITGSTYAYELNTAALNGDLAYSSGTLDIAAGSILTLTDLATSTALTNGSKLTLISYFGGWTGGELFTYNAATLADNSTFTLGANQWFFDYNDTGAGSNFTGDIVGATSFVTMTVIPEPNAAMLVGGLGMLALLRRRRNA